MSALHAEWTKARTSPGTFWLLFGVLAVTVAVSGLAVAARGRVLEVIGGGC